MPIWWCVYEREREREKEHWACVFLHRSLSSKLVTDYRTGEGRQRRRTILLLLLYSLERERKKKKRAGGNKTTTGRLEK